MTSDSASDTARGLWWRGLVAGAAAGACTGLADTLRAFLAGRELLQPRDAPDVVAFYAACFAVCGLAASFAARAFDLPRRALHLLVVFGAAFFFVGAWMNVSLLPGFTSGLALTADAILLLVTALWFRNRYRDTALDGMRTGRWCVAGVVAAALAFAGAELLPRRDEGAAPIATAADGAPRPNVLVVLCDTLRADHLGCMGYDRPTSPEIDAFAKDAALFGDCRAVSSWTKPSVASMFTSLYPTMHGCVEQRQVLAPEHETLPEVFRAAGWRTAAFVDNPFVSPEFGFGQGFAEADYHYVRPSVVANGTLLGKALFMTRLLSLVGRPLGVGEREDDTASLRRRFLAFVDAANGAPWFAYVHAMDPHLPYEPAPADAAALGAAKPWLVPPAYNGILPFEKTPPLPAAEQARLVAQYDAEIRGFSREFGAIVAGLAERGRLEDTIVVLVSDHGEEFHDHGGWTHGHSLHREVTQVPFVVRLPASLGPAAAASRGVRVGGVATLLDVMPTLLELASIRYPRGDDRRSGESLAPQLLAKPGTPRSIGERILLGEVTMQPVGIRSIRQGRWQLIEAHRPPMDSSSELFDDLSDPRHTRDRTGESPSEAGALRRRLAEKFGVLEQAASVGAEIDLDPETAERLRGLGYVNEKR